MEADHHLDKPENSAIMEVHHAKIKNKNFKEYFLEFIMIFLAVTLGFFAESFREQVVESKRVAIV